MHRSKNIVTGVDFSEQSRNALTEAARVAEWNQAKLRLVNVVEAEAVRHLAVHEGRDVEELRAELTRESQTTLQEWATALNLQSRVSERVRFGDAADEVLGQVKEVGAELLVVGVTGLADDSPGAGAQATRLVRSAPCDVLLVNKNHEGPFNRVAAGIDFSPTSREAVEKSLRIAQQDDSEVLFIHVYSAPWRRLHLPRSHKYSSEFRADYVTKLETELREFVGDLGGVRASFHLVQNQKHGRGMSGFAQEQQADLLVVGARGRSKLGYMLLGSTAEYLLREQPCSVLTIRPK